MSRQVRIGTHSGSFHVDEALGVWMLRRLDEFQNATVVRSRDETVLAECDIVIDVGGEYDAARKRLDHHQRGFFEVFGAGKTVKLSSAGLVYKHYGQDVLKKILGDSVSDEAELGLIYEHVYDEFIEGIDGVDNGVPAYQSSVADAVIVPAYKVQTDISARVGRLNKSWNHVGNFDSDAAFEKASNLAGDEMLYFCHEAASSWLPSRRIVAEAFASRTHPEIVVLKQFCPWGDHLFKLDTKEEVKYVIFGDADSYRVRAVAISPGSFESRLGLPEKWRGLRDASLDDHLTVKGGVFVHATGFIGGHKTLEGAIQMAKDSIALQKN